VKAKDIRQNSIEELRSSLKDARKKYLDMRFQHAAGTLKTPLELRRVRREIARLLTVINEKEK